MTENGIQAFADAALEYDAWFEAHRPAYESELLALKRLFRPQASSLEIGVGPGRFAASLQIGVGVEPAAPMAQLAHRRGIAVIRARGENLPFRANSFRQVLLVSVLCFLPQPERVLTEARRVLKPGGRIIIGMIDRDSPLGRQYQARQSESKFYRHATFYGVRQVLTWLENLGYENLEFCQTLVGDLEEQTAVEPVRPGFGKGGFVVLAAEKGWG